MPRPRLATSTGISREKFSFARQLRRRMTPQEAVLWERLRAGRSGFQFRRQQVVSGFIVDFLCIESRLVVEVDGPIHNAQAEQDELRDAALATEGLLVLRIRNDEVDETTDVAVARIVEACRARSTRR